MFCSHTSFVVSYARLYAAVCGVTYSQQVLVTCYWYSAAVPCDVFVPSQDLSPDTVSSVVMATHVPPFKPSSKVLNDSPKILSPQNISL